MPTPVTLCSNDAKEEIEISRYKNKGENKDAKSRRRRVSGVGMMPKGQFAACLPRRGTATTGLAQKGGKGRVSQGYHVS